MKREPIAASLLLFLPDFFDTVHTIDISEIFHKKAQDIFMDSPHVHCHLGSSEQVLKELLPSLTNERILFYLDAHWHSYWPLLDELDTISHTHQNNCIIVHYRRLPRSQIDLSLIMRTMEMLSALMNI